MRIYITGIDGYLGWTLAQHLVARGHHVGGCDSSLRRGLVKAADAESVIPIGSVATRQKLFKQHLQDVFTINEIDVAKHAVLLRCELEEFEPDAIVHLAEIPSAPYSMQDGNKARFTQENNILGTMNLLWAMRELCPDAHLLKLGTMGEYGTPDYVITESPSMPMDPGSFYHASKCADTLNIRLACRLWGLRSTDIMQGVVYGVRSSKHQFLTRFDVDEYFGTAINRFVAQALSGQDITVYGSGTQRRGFIPLRESMKCLTLALENPPRKSEYRVFNQLAEVMELRQLADAVALVHGSADVVHLDNLRGEAMAHLYVVRIEGLEALGYEPELDMLGDIKAMMKDLEPYVGNIGDLTPTLRWNK